MLFLSTCSDHISVWSKTTVSTTTVQAKIAIFQQTGFPVSHNTPSVALHVKRVSFQNVNNFLTQDFL